MTFEQAFDKIKEKFAKADASKAADFAMQITLTDEDCGGTMYIAAKDGVLAVEPYDYHDNTSYVNITKSALLAILAGRASLDKAISDGDAMVGGDAADNMKAAKSTIKKAAAKTTAKKTAAKKPAAKKTAAKKPAAKKTAAKAAPAKATPAKTTTAKTTAAKTAPAAKTATVAKTAAAPAKAPAAKTTK